MKKIPCLFEREVGEDGQFNRLVIDQPNSQADVQWVLDGEGIATKKYDGTCCYINPAGKLYKRYDAKIDKKTGDFKTPPENFLPAQSPDKITGHWPGWVPVDFEAKSDQRHVEAFDNLIGMSKQTEKRSLFGAGVRPGTYELIGPKVNGNPENVDSHILVYHGDVIYNSFPRTFDEIRERLIVLNVEGVVFHRKPGAMFGNDMVKIRLADFGLERKKHIDV